jgi:MFS transporter, UMF1 family
VAGLCVALGGPVLGAIADQGRRRKRWLATATVVCVAGTAGLWFIQPDPSYLWPAVVLLVIATIASEFAAIFYNAMLADLAPPERIGRWSGWGWAAGYIGGLACLVVALFVFVQEGRLWSSLDTESGQHIRGTFVLAAGWFLIFALPLLLGVRERPEPRPPTLIAIRQGLRQLAGSIRHARQYRHIIRFLIAHLIYIDALATVFALGGVYAAGTFKMDERQVLLFGIGLNITAGIGAAAMAWIDDWAGPRKTILLSLAGLVVTSAVILAVQSVTAFWVIGLTLGLFVGPVQAAGRSYLSRAAPAELRNEMFGLYALSGKATAFAGPMLVGWLTFWSGSQRVGMVVVVALFAAGLLVMLTVPPPHATLDPVARAQRPDEEVPG